MKKYLPWILVAGAAVALALLLRDRAEEPDGGDEPFFAETRRTWYYRWVS